MREAFQVALCLVFGLLGACSESSPVIGPPTEPSESQVDPPDPAVKAEHVVTLTGTSVEFDGAELVRLRPADVPGTLDAELRPTHAYVELEQAFAKQAPTRLQQRGESTVGALRGVGASLPGDRKLELDLGEGESITLRFGPRADAPLLRVLDERVELRRAGVVVGRVDSLAALGDLVSDAAESFALEIDDRASSEAVKKIGRTLRGLGQRELLLAMDYEPCLTPPQDMACVPGGFAIVGSDDHGPEERPRREIELSTFYIDRFEITIAQYDACREQRACPRRLNGEQNIMKPFVGPNQPVVPMDWERAVRYCAWTGKRLPSEWEWEKAARGPAGDLYPWGNEEPTCERAQYRECAPWGCTPYPGKASRWDCNEHDTKPVGTYPAGHYGLHEMAGNGYEWTSSVGPADLSTCGDACNGRDPKGPCDGAFPCGNTRVLRGGSWYWPADLIRGSHRRVEVRKTGGHRLSARCATSNPFLSAHPSSALEFPRALPPDPAPPSAEEVQAFAGVVQDPIEDKPICSATVREGWGQRGGRSETTCRDPYPYLESNEPRAWLWGPYLTNIGGAYLGVGSDQNYTFIALARSQWAWVMDYDPRVTDHHRRLRAFVLASESPEQFIEMWSSNSTKAAEAALAEHDPRADLAKLRRGYHATRERLHEYYREQAERPGAEGWGWLANADHYAYVRAMFSHGRIQLIKGDLLGKDSMRTVGDAARALGVPIRVFYTSNAPISWGGQLTAEYRANVLGLLFDHRTIVLQTTAKGGFRQSGHWHHNVQWGRHMHARLREPGYLQVFDMLFERIPAGHGDLTTIGLPSGLPD